MQCIIKQSGTYSHSQLRRTAKDIHVYIHDVYIYTCMYMMFHMKHFQNNPLLSFFQFHEQFSLSCDLDQCKKNLLEFDLAMTKVNM